MPTDENQRADEQDASTRRTFLKTGALASVGTALALGSGAASAETGTNAAALQEQAKGLIFQNSFRPGARFVFTSGVVEWVPNVPEVQDNVWTNYQTRMIRYLNTNEQVPFFVARDANIGQFNENLGFVTDQQDAQQPNVYEMDREFTVFGDSGFLVTANFSTIPENEETSVLENDDWWQQQQGGGGGTQTTGGGNQTGGNQTGGNQSGG
ncbi:twin-arginine translocation signal domain-containing protein [Haladaptatus salinisoli]|uniref:twin-arginine translocation signal domain-containing protein n=1 Tax=Haladaptatus salinisoli TaxID=2884876 RepID=UPI001D0AB7C7|nr:twin-arginine translocation signal domain-containing protein [Haladaptatus salinisoli]